MVQQSPQKTDSKSSRVEEIFGTLRINSISSTKNRLEILTWLFGSRACWRRISIRELDSCRVRAYRPTVGTFSFWSSPTIAHAIKIKARMNSNIVQEKAARAQQSIHRTSSVLLPSPLSFRTHGSA